MLGGGGVVVVMVVVVVVVVVGVVVVNGCYGNSHLQRCSSDSRCGTFDDRTATYSLQTALEPVTERTRFTLAVQLDTNNVTGPWVYPCLRRRR